MGCGCGKNKVIQLFLLIQDGDTYRIVPDTPGNREFYKDKIKCEGTYKVCNDCKIRLS